MTERILVPYDGSACTDEAVAKAIELAGRRGASLYLLALGPADDNAADSPLPPSARLTDDLITFARAGARLGIDIDGSYLAAPTTSLLHAAIEAHQIDRVLMVRDAGADDPGGHARLFNALAGDCPVPVTVLSMESNT
jgi:nucleotide-binding universal stress UspA family protein